MINKGVFASGVRSAAELLIAWISVEMSDILSNIDDTLSGNTVPGTLTAAVLSPILRFLVLAPAASVALIFSARVSCTREDTNNQGCSWAAGLQLELLCECAAHTHHGDEFLACANNICTWLHDWSRMQELRTSLLTSSRMHLATEHV